jgi:hypothetical protein
MITIEDRGITCRPVAWTHDGPVLQHDEEHAFQYEVRKAGNLIGYMVADRARQHPDVRWKRSRVQGTKTEELDGTYDTVEAALAAF